MRRISIYFLSVRIIVTLPPQLPCYPDNDLNNSGSFPHLVKNHLHYAVVLLDNNIIAPILVRQSVNCPRNPGSTKPAPRIHHVSRSRICTAAFRQDPWEVQPIQVSGRAYMYLEEGDCQRQHGDHRMRVAGIRPLRGDNKVALSTVLIETAVNFWCR